MAKEPKSIASQGGLEKDIFRMGDDFYIVYLYGDVDDRSEFLRKQGCCSVFAPQCIVATVKQGARS